jgi:hypothetical protein
MLRTDRLSGFLGLLGLAGLASTSACAGPPVPAPVDGVPVCTDFDLGRAKMEGTLRHPVRMRVLDGKAQLFKHIITGLRKEDAAKPRTLIVDDNAEYTVEWAQCANERAPRSIAEAAHANSKAKDRGHDPETGYDCGEATVYKTDKLVTKKGDRASHTIAFAAPPDAACWKGDAPKPPAPPPPPVIVELDAGADAAAAPAPSDAGTADVAR